MYGFVVTTHYNNYDIIKKCLDLLFKYIPENSYVILFVNETTCEKMLNIKNEYNDYYINNKFNVIYIDDQVKNGGLTGTWNQGINYLLNLTDFKCKVISILGHDSFVNHNIIKILQLGIDAENNKKLLYFGPLCKSEKYTGINMWQDVNEYKKHKMQYLTGFFLTFPIYSLLKNKINKIFFDDENYPFAGNEVEWYLRFKKLNGEGILCTDFIIDHDHNRSWLELENKIQNEKGEVYSLLYYSNKIKDLNFNWANYLRKNRDLHFSNEKEALNHYMSIGKYQNRLF
tara:strand:- start:919 stop:1776 length:858 start_codon:yes stop_codon:yes gene_type:complete